MLRTIAGAGAGLLAVCMLTACGNEPEPLGPAGSNYESTREAVDEQPVPPMTPAPGTVPDPFTEPGLPGSQPGEIPEVIEEEPPPMDELAPPEDRGDTPDETGAPL